MLDKDKILFEESNKVNKNKVFLQIKRCHDDTFKFINQDKMKNHGKNDIHYVKLEIQLSFKAILTKRG